MRWRCFVGAWLKAVGFFLGLFGAIGLWVVGNMMLFGMPNGMFTATGGAIALGSAFIAWDICQ